MGTHDMIDISVTSKHGNTALSLPHHGYFGVTPVMLAGTVHLKLHSEYPHALPIRSVQLEIQCYEAVSSGAFRTTPKGHVRWEYTHDLWRPKAGSQELPFPTSGVWDHPFKLRIPTEVAEFTSGCKAFREWRAKWRFAVIVNHKPIAHVGHSIARSWPLHLRDHRSSPTTPTLPPSPPSGGVFGTGSTATQIFVNPPAGSFGPLDPIPLSVSVRPEDPTTIVRKVSVMLERRLKLVEKPSTSGRRSASPTPPAEEEPPHKASRISAIFNRSVSPRVRTEEDTTFMTVTPIEEVALDIAAQPGSWCTGSLVVPQRTSRWDIGETERTHLVDVSFAIRVKATVKSRKHNTSKELISGSVPVILLASSAAERATAADAKKSASAASSVVLPPYTPEDRKVRHQASLTLHEAGPSSRRSSRKASPSILISRDDSCSQYSGSSSNSSRAVFVYLPSLYDEIRRTSSAPATRVSSAAASPTSATFGPLPLPPVRSILRYSSPTPTLSVESNSPQSAPVLSPPPLNPVVNGSRRRISTSTSEDDALQPLRSRPKLFKSSDPAPFGLATIPPDTVLTRRSPTNNTRLPSLDTLGLGLPQVPDAGRPRSRPSTAPHPTSFGVYAASFGNNPDDQRPKSSGSSFAFTMPLVGRPSMRHK